MKNLWQAKQESCAAARKPCSAAAVNFSVLTVVFHFISISCEKVPCPPISV